MTRTTDALLEPDFGTVGSFEGESSSSAGNGGADSTISTAGPALLDRDMSGIITWSSNNTASAPIFARLDRWFARPCTIPSPLNEF